MDQMICIIMKIISSYSASGPNNESVFSNQIYFLPDHDIPCNLTNEESLIMDAAANLITTWHGWQMEKLGEMINSAGGKAAFTKLSAGLFGANLALAWLKLIAAIVMIRGEITVEGSLPLLRTKNAKPGEKKLMKARIWSEVGKKELLNCVRTYINTFTGLDFNLPSDGPLSETAVEWHFAGENENLVLKKYVVFESPEGKDRNPRLQITDENGISQMFLVGASKIPTVEGKKTIDIPKKAIVIVGVTLKSANNISQNFIDIGGTVLGIATGGPLGILMAIPEIGFRLPYVPARIEIPVTDHEPCDGQWYGTISYNSVRTTTSRKTIEKSVKGNDITEGGHENLDETITLSGTFSLNGLETEGTSSAEESFNSDFLVYGKVKCSMKRGPDSYSRTRIVTASSAGNTQGKTTASISLDNDRYTITIRAIPIHTTRKSTEQNSTKGNCGGDKPTSFTNSGPWAYGANDPFVAKATNGADKNALVGSDTKTKTIPVSVKNMVSSITTVTTITWNLRRCNN
jgi:hypothetical protein